MVSLVFLGSAALVAGFDCRWLCRGLVDHAHHGLLQRLPLEEEAVLVPEEVGSAQLKVMALHATLKQREDVAVVRVGCEGQPAAVVHELLELGRLVKTQLVNCNLLLLALDVIIFFILGASWETLPWKGSTKEVEKHVADSF